MGEIWPKKKSAGRRSIIEGSVLEQEVLGENGEQMGKNRGQMGEKWPKKSGGKLT